MDPLDELGERIDGDVAVKGQAQMVAIGLDFVCVLFLMRHDGLAEVPTLVRRLPHIVPASQLIVEIAPSRFFRADV